MILWLIDSIMLKYGKLMLNDKQPKQAKNRTKKEKLFYAIKRMICFFNERKLISVERIILDIV